MIKRNGSVVCLAVSLLFLLTACGGNEKTAFVEINPDVQGNFILEEPDMDAAGIGNPGGICIHDDNLYVCDTENNCIVRLDKEFQPLGSYGTLGMEYGNFSEPMDITFSGNSFYVLDSGNNRVQKFTADFEYAETYNLDHLASEQGYGKYVSIAVDGEGVIYVSAISPDSDDACIFYRKGDEWNRLGENMVGYLCEGDGKIYFANTLELQVEEKKTIIQSGKNLLYEIDSGKLKPVARFMDKYAPAALVCQHDRIYMISAGLGCVHYFDGGTARMETVITLPEVSTHMYMCLDEEGNIYITENETGKFYHVTQ